MQIKFLTTRHENAIVASIPKSIISNRAFISIFLACYNNLCKDNCNFVIIIVCLVIEFSL